MSKQNHIMTRGAVGMETSPSKMPCDVSDDKCDGKVYKVVEYATGGNGE